MARVTWKHSEPAPNPFEGVAGDFTEYVVHLCEARAHKDEEADILASVLQPALEAAKRVQREEARFILCDFDPVYSILTIVVTDGNRTKDEREVFKLVYHDWDQEMQHARVSDSEYEELCRASERRMYAFLQSTLRMPSISALIQPLKDQGFEFWFANANPEGEWEHLDV